MSVLSTIRDYLPVSRARFAALQADLASTNTRLKFNKADGSGVDMTFGRFEYETNANLRGSKKWETLEKMESDAHVKAQLRHVILPLQAADWSFVAASDDPKDEEIRDFCSANLLRESNDLFGREYWIQTSWRAQRLPEILDMLRAGLSVFASTFRRVGSKVVYDRLQWIEPATIDGTKPWILDDFDNILAINRKFNTPNDDFVFDKELPADRLKLYVHDLKGARYEGRPYTRSMYGSWMRKEELQRLAVIFAQKVGAPPPVGSYPHGWDTTAINQFEKFVKQARGMSPAEAFFSGPMNREGQKAEITYAGAEVENVDRMRGLVDGENKEIAHAGGTKGQMLGETQSGSRALGESQGLVEMQFVQAVADTVIEWETQGVANLLGTVQELVDLNYADVTAYPQLVVSNINPFEGLQSLPELVKASAAGLIPKHAEVRKQVSELFGLDLPEEAFDQEPAPTNVFADEPEDDEPEGTPDDEEKPPMKVAASLETEADFKERIAPLLVPVQEGAPDSGGGFRFPTVLETRFVALAAVDRSLRTGERDMMQIAREGWARMVAEMFRRLKRGKITERSVGSGSQRRSKFSGEKRLTAKFSVTLQSVGDTGTQHARDEVSRQAPEPLRVALAAEGLIEQADLVAGMNVGRIWDRVLGEFLGEWDRLNRQQLTLPELQLQLSAFMDNLSEAPLRDVARTSSAVAYNQGRNVGILEAQASELVEFVVRSEVLDTGTCRPCGLLDGEAFEVGTSEYFANMPPAQCDGGDRCRGFYIPVGVA